jgi:hypothetical protein
MLGGGKTISLAPARNQSTISVIPPDRIRVAKINYTFAFTVSFMKMCLVCEMEGCS